MGLTISAQGAYSDEMGTCATDLMKSHASQADQLKSVLLTGASDPQRFTKLTDNTFLTDSHKQAAIQLWNADTCHVDWVALMKQSSPSVSVVWENGFVERDLIRAALLTDQLTIGQFNQKLMSLYASLNAKSVQAAPDLAILYDWGSRRLSNIEASSTEGRQQTAKIEVRPAIKGRSPVKKPDSQLENWDGVNLYGFIDHRATTAELKAKSSVSTRYNVDGVGRNSIAGGLGLDYSKKFNSKFVGFAGISYDITDVSLAKFSVTSSGTNGTAEVKEKNRYSFYFGGGPLLTPTTLMYGKLSYNYSDIQLTTNVSPSVEGLSDANYSAHGIGYSVGIRQLLDNYFLGVEMGRVNYSTGDILNADSATGTTLGSFYFGRKF